MFFINPATVKLLLKLAEQALTDEKTRKRLFMIIMIPIVSFLLLIVGAQYILETPKRVLQDFFVGDDAEIVENLASDDSGYFSNTGEPFVIGDYANVDATDPVQFAILLEYASQFIGRAYVWGGSTPQTGFDCSGFICYVYTNSSTYNLPRTTAQGIFNQCTPVPREEAKAGDLIFFQGTYNSDGPVSHIGMYLSDGKMLHCGDPIGITSIDTSYWTAHFYSFGRLGTAEIPFENLLEDERS